MRVKLYKIHQFLGKHKATTIYKYSNNRNITRCSCGYMWFKAEGCTAILSTVWRDKVTVAQAFGDLLTDKIHNQIMDWIKFKEENGISNVEEQDALCSMNLTRS